MRIFSILALALLLAAPARAQQDPRHHMMGQGMMHEGMGMMHGGMDMMMQGGMGMMMSGLPTPGMILHAADELDLTENQRNRLETMQAELIAAIQPHMQAAMDAHGQAAAALGAEPVDMTGYEAALETAMQEMVRAHVAQARAGVQARNLLTAPQREKLEGAVGMMHGMMGGMMSEMMGHGMMGGGTGGGMMHGRGTGGG